MNAGPAGFRGAPVTKALLLGTVGSSVITQARVVARARRASVLGAAWGHAFAFRHPGELLFGAALLYFSRLFERQWGSAKYGSFVAVTCGVAYLLEAAASAALALPSAAGPLPLIFANLAANFVLMVPPMHQFTLFGLKMTDKAFIYLAAIQLLLSSPPYSLVAGGCGLLAGALYRLNFLGLQRLRLPAAVVELFRSTLGRALGAPTQGQQQQVFVTPTLAQQQQQLLQQQRQRQQGHMGGRGGGYGPYDDDVGGEFGGGLGVPAAAMAAAAAEVAVASPEAVQQLVAMGFDEDSAAAALRQTGNNVEAALQLLL